MSVLITCETAGQKVPACFLSPDMTGGDNPHSVALAAQHQNALESNLFEMREDSVCEVSRGDATAAASSARHGKVARLREASDELDVRLRHPYSESPNAVTLNAADLRRLHDDWDAAALYAAQTMASELHVSCLTNPYAHGLIDVSRSLHNRALFSEITRPWTEAARQCLIDQVYQPYRARVQSAVAALLARNGFVVHLSLRSLPLRSAGKIMRTDVGLLYDPARQDESDLCHDWACEMWYLAPMLKVRRNYPGRGTRDSLCRAMRTEFATPRYVGVEVQLNRAWAGREVAIRDVAIRGICEAFLEVIDAARSAANAA